MQQDSKPDLIARIRTGAECWNAWRNKKFKALDLRESDLQGYDLSGFNLSLCLFGKANLTDAQLIGANLRGSNFGYALLSGANLHQADMHRGILSLATFTKANLERADLSETLSQGVNFTEANMRSVSLHRAELTNSIFARADLQDAYCRMAGFVGTDMRRADLRRALLMGSDFYAADLRRADLRDANLERTSLIECDLSYANLTGCYIYGAGVWDVRLNKTIQNNLIIQGVGGGVHNAVPEPGLRDGQSCRHRGISLEVDNLQVAQFIHLILENRKIRDVIDTVSKKVVLILGRFTPKRKPVLEAIRLQVRKLGYIPVLFDFEPPRTRDLTETVSLLAHLSRFIIADLTGPRSIPQELMRIVPALPSVPIQPILASSNPAYSMFEHPARFPSVLKPVRYKNIPDLMQGFEGRIITPAEERATALQPH